MRAKVLLAVITSALSFFLGARWYEQPSQMSYGWTKILGGTDYAYSTAITTDSLGNVFLTGYFQGTVNFGLDFGVMDQRTDAGESDIFITKINANGTYGWTKIIGGTSLDRSFAVTTDSSDSVYVGGVFFETVDFGHDFGTTDIKTGTDWSMFVTKINSNGTYGWTKTIGGAVACLSIKVNISGDIYLTGDFSGTVDFGGDFGTSDFLTSYLGSPDIFITKINADLTYGWTRTLYSGEEADYGKAVAVDLSGNVYVTGWRENYPMHAFPIVIIKINADGTWGWVKHIYGSPGSSYFPGGSGNGIVTDGLGNVFIAGNFSGTVDFGQPFGTTDVKTSDNGSGFVMGINSDGTYGWTKTLGGGAEGIAQDSLGNFYVTGSFDLTANFGLDFGVTDVKTSAGARDIYVTRINANGTYGRTKVMGGTANDHGDAITTDTYGNAYVTGTFAGLVDFGLDFGTTDIKNSAGQSDSYITKISYYSVPHIRTPIAPVDFGNVNAGNHSDQTITVYNDGDAPLIIGNISRSSGSDEFAYLSPATPFSVIPGGSQTITIRFSPLSFGAKSGQFAIASNDLDAPGVTFNVSGVSVSTSGPDIDLPSTNPNFGDVKVDLSTDLDFPIRNLGNADLTISSISRTAGSSEFSVLSYPSSIGVGGSGYAKIRFSPLTSGAKSAEFDINSNDPDEADVVFAAAGGGVLCDDSPSNHKILPEAIWAPATGGGTWVSEVQITDLSGGSVVSVYFSYGGGNRRGPFTLWTGPGMNSSVKFSNILSSIDGLDIGTFTYYGRVGAVEFVTQDGSHNIQVAARTLNGNYSKTLPGFNFTGSNTADTTRPMMIQNYVNNAAYRSTCGFFNPTADPVTVEFRLLNYNGNLIGSAFSKSFAAYDFQAFSPFNEAGVPYPGYSYDNVTLLVNPTSGMGRVMGFGASANNRTNDPAAHIAVQYQGAYDNSPSDYQVLPEAIWAPATGGGIWVSEVQITDLTGGSMVTAYFDYGGGARRGPFTIWTNYGGANRNGKFANILSSLQSLDSGLTYYGRVGAVEFSTQDSAHKIQVVARTTNEDYSKTFPGLNLTDSNTADTTRKMMIQNYVNNVTYRSTCGFFNPTADPVTVEFRLVDGSGSLIGAAFTRTFVGYDFKAFSPFNEAGIPYPSYFFNNVFLLINPISGAGKLMCFGASANNATNDPAAHIAVQYQ